MKAKFSNDRIWVKVLLQIEIPRLSEDVDIVSIRKILNEYVTSLIPRINIQDLKDWSLLIWVAFRSTNGIGVFKRARRYPSDKEYTNTFLTVLNMQ